jgi:hypothetical protein
VKKRFFPICLVSVVLIALIALLVPSCTPTTQCTIDVKAALDGSPWSGAVNYTLTPVSGSAITGTNVSASFSVACGTWTCAYVSGGPAGAYLESITSSATQNVTGSTITFTLNFKTTTPTTPNTLQVNATLDGSPWSGAVQYTLTSSVWPAIQGNIVPGSAWSANPGFWKCNYIALGPDGAILDNITPLEWQDLTPGGTITFTLNFTTGTGNIQINATLDGIPWRGLMVCELTSPVWPSYQENIAPGSAWGVKLGVWTCTYIALGPDGAILVNITPSPTQTLPSGGTITFTLNFETPIGIEFAIKDAEVRESEPDRNLGAEPEMWVGPLVPPEDVLRHRAFVWFSLASLPAGATIQSATLYLYHSACRGSGDATHGAFRVTTVWEELIITWNNQPPSVAGPTDEISFPVCDIGKWRSWDVTPDIDALAIETGWVSWVIKIIPETSSVRKRVVYQTKEGGPAPYLEITYTP